MFGGELLVLVVVLLLGQTNCYSTGAGASRCESMEPSHYGTSPSTDPAPFYIEISQNYYQPGHSLTVKIALKEDSTDGKFKGFLLEARRADLSKNRTETIGFFTSSLQDRTQNRCTSPFGTGLTHTNTNSLRQSVIAAWTAPETDQGPLEFRATVVVRYTLYWIGQKSVIISFRSAPTTVTAALTTVSSPMTTEPAAVTTINSSMTNRNKTEATTWPVTTLKPMLTENNTEATTWPETTIEPLVTENKTEATTRPVTTIRTPNTIDVSTCGISKGCFRHPANCTDSTCEMLVTWSWKDQEEKVMFQLSAATDGWVAVGFSNDQKMKDDSVSECIYVASKGQVEVQNSYNKMKEHENEVVKHGGLEQLMASLATDIGTRQPKLRCSFTREIISQNPKIFDLRTNYYMMVAMGAETDGTKNQHSLSTGKRPIISRAKVDLTRSFEVESLADDPYSGSPGKTNLINVTLLMLSLVCQHFMKLLGVQ